MIVQFCLLKFQPSLLNEPLLLLLHLNASLVQPFAGILNLLDLFVISESVRAPDSWN